MGLFDFFKPKDDSRELLLGMVTHNAHVIQKDEGKIRSEAEYLALCLVYDDLRKRPNGRAGYQTLVGILKDKYPQHLSDVVYYVAWTTGKIHLKPDAEAEMQKRHSKEPPATFVFKSGASFFELQCKYGDTKIEKGKGVVAIILDAREEFGTPVAVKVEQDGRQVAVLRVASEDGGFVVTSQTPSGTGDRLHPGDIVVWVPSDHSEEVGEVFQDERSGWIGFIRAKVKPELEATATGQLSFFCRYN
jgi:hypothetical protein